MFYESFLCESHSDEHIPPEYYEDDIEYIYTDEDAGMDDYEWQLWLRRQRELAELKEKDFV